MKDEYFYKFAHVKGIRNCSVVLKQYDEDNDQYLCIMPFGREMWKDSKELERFSR